MATLVRRALSPDPFSSTACPVVTNAPDFHSSGRRRTLSLCSPHMTYWGNWCTVIRKDSHPSQVFKAMHSKNQKRHGSASGSRAPLVPLKAKMSLSQSDIEPLPFRVPHDYPHSRFNRAPLAVYPPKGAHSKACVSLPVVSLEKMPCFSRSEGAQIKVSSTPSATVSPLSIQSSSSASFSPSSSSLKSSHTSPASCKNQLVNGRGSITPCSTTPPLLADRRLSPSQSSPLDKRLSVPSTALSSVDRRPAVPASPPERKHLNGAKSSSHKRVSGRVYDPNKHCGVLDPESKRPCTRSLTCKTHSLTQRRTVQGRRKDFDILLAEHKGRAKEKDAGQKRDTASSQATQATQPLNPPSSTSTVSHNDMTTPTLKLQLASIHTHRSSAGAGGGGAGVGGGGTVALSSTTLHATDQIPSCQKYSGDVHESSDEAEADFGEELEETSCHYSSYHPRPINWCAFSSRLMGQGHYVFDRHWDRMRIALHCMVEKHVTAQMWRKVPLAAESMLGLPESSALSMSLLPSPTPHPDLLSTVSCSTPLLQNGTKSFCRQDSKLQLNKTARLLKASADGLLFKKHKSHPVVEKRNGIGYLSGPMHICNSVAALSMRSKSSHAGASQGLASTDRYTSTELNLPQTSKDGQGAVLSQSLPPCGSTERRKRKTSSCERVGKVTKTMVHNEIFQKSSTALLSTRTEAPHGTLPRLSKVHQ